MSRFFDRIDDQITLGDVGATEGLSAASVAIWVWPQSATPGVGGNGVVGKWENTSAAVQSYLLWHRASDNNFAFRMHNSSDTGVNSGLWTPVAQTWNFLCGVYNGATVELYVNGTVQGSGGALTGTTKNGTATLRVGAYDVSGAGLFGGNLAHFHFYNRALSVREQLQIMRYPGSIANGRVIYMPLWGAGSPEPDYSGNNNSGTVTGATAGKTNPPINGIFQVPRPELITVF